MKSEKGRIEMTAFVFKAVLIASFIILSSLIGFADDTITGHYCYTYGDNESLKEAREITRALAVRNAIESYRAFITSASTVKNFQLTNDLVQIISSGYLRDIKTVEHKEEGRTICEEIRASISAQAIESIVKTEVRKRIKEAEEIGLDNNGYLKILNIRKKQGTLSGSRYEYISVIAKVLQPTGSLFFPSEKNGKPYFKICADLLDSEGNPIKGCSKFVHNEKVEMLPGEIKEVWLCEIGNDVKSYRVWLPAVPGQKQPVTERRRR